MEFTEVSELRKKIAAARLDIQRQHAREVFNSSKSGFRRHFLVKSPFGPDLTVARLFSSSPPSDTYTVAEEETEEKSTAFATVNAHRERRRRNQQKGGNYDEIETEDNKEDDNGQTKAQPDETKKNRVVTPTFGRKAATDILAFEYQTVNNPRASESLNEVESNAENGIKDNMNLSLLSQIVRNKQAIGSKVITGPSLSLKIYLPDHVASEYEVIEIALNSTVNDTISAVIEQHLEKMGHSLVYGPEELASNLKLRLNAKCYELRMHEESGIPDEDFPALDRSRLIKNFNEVSSEDGTAEYCLCFIPGTENEPDEEYLKTRFDHLVQAKRRIIESEAEEGKSGGVSGSQDEKEHINRLSKAIKRLKGGVAIKVVLPENMNTMHTTLQVTKGMKAYELLSKVQKKQNLPLYTEEFQFVISEEDRNRLSLISRIIDMNTDIYEDIHCLGVRTIELRRRKYADAPTPRS